jgi:hypothetical protein
MTYTLINGFDCHLCAFFFIKLFGKTKPNGYEMCTKYDYEKSQIE